MANHSVFVLYLGLIYAAYYADDRGLMQKIKGQASEPYQNPM